MAKNISASVGKGGKNKPDDVTTVQELLNPFASAAGFGKLKVDGVSGPKTQGAIAKFQANIVKGKVDSRIDPGYATMKKLQLGPAKVKEEAKKEEAKAKEEAKKEEAKSGGNLDDLKPGRIEGPISGVDKKITDSLFAVSAFYGTTIVVTSGKRSAKEQGETMWKYWTVNLDRGLIYEKLKSDSKLRKELDNLFNEKKKAEFVKIIEKDAKSYSRHVWGGAIDIKKETNAKIVNAIGTLLRVVVENTCYHLDTKGKTPKLPVPESIKKQWKR